MLDDILCAAVIAFFLAMIIMGIFYLRKGEAE